MPEKEPWKKMEHFIRTVWISIFKDRELYTNIEKKEAVSYQII